MFKFQVTFQSTDKKDKTVITLEANSEREAFNVCHDQYSGFMPDWVKNLIIIYPQFPPYHCKIKKLK